MADFERLDGETPRAFRAFTLFRDLAPQQRSLRAVCQTLALEHRASGLRFVPDDEGAERAPEERRKKEHGRVSLWSRRHRWQERAASWDSFVDRHVRQRQIELIEAMAARHAAQVEQVAEHLMRPVLAFARAMEDPVRRATFENLSVLELFQLSLSACALLPRLQAAERLARGCRVVSNNGITAPGSPQVPAEWRVSVYQPPREQALPTRQDIAQTSADEWEEAEVGR